MKLAVIGGGSTYTPELVSGFLEEKNIFPDLELYLMDKDKKRLEIVGGLIERMIKAGASPIKLFCTTDLNEALSGAQFVIAQIRVGGMDARLKDEEIPLSFECIGQETTGAGGFSCALRTVPVMVEIAKKMEELCPAAWLINFTNPSGLITEAVSRYARTKVIGLCNVPIVMHQKIAELLEASRADIAVDYFGLNHLSFIRDIIYKGNSVFSDIYSDASYDVFDKELIKNLELIPSYYLNYYFNKDIVLKEQMGGKIRAKEVIEIEKELIKKYKDPALNTKPKELTQRGGALYSQAAIEVISSLLSRKEKILIVNLPQKGVFKDMPFSSVIELPALISLDKVLPVQVKQIPEPVKGIIRIVKEYEELTIQAAFNGSCRLALQALLIHPLVGSYSKAKGILDLILKEHKAYLQRFTNQKTKEWQKLS